MKRLKTKIRTSAGGLWPCRLLQYTGNLSPVNNKTEDIAFFTVGRYRSSPFHQLLS